MMLVRRITAAVVIFVVIAAVATIDHFDLFENLATNGHAQSQKTANVSKDRPITSLRDLNNAFVDIAEAVNPTVVTVFTEKVLRVQRRHQDYPFFANPFEEFFKDFFDQQPQPRRAPEQQEYRQRGLGSGVIVTQDGYILTNNHVIQDADTINVRLMDDRVLSASVIGTDPKTDIAVLKVDAKDLPRIEFGDSDDLRVGEWVLAIGSPLSANLAHTVTNGIVSAKGRSNVGLAEYEDFIQTDAAINPGNSGGALVNLDGKLVGINTAIASRSGGYQGIGFAVPVNMARRVMESIIDHGKVVRGWLGVSIQDVDETLMKAMDLGIDEGALVAEVVDESPADKADIKPGDVIVELDGEKIKNTTQLRNTVASKAPGSSVSVTIFRDKKEKRVSVELEELKPEEIAADAEERLQELFGFKVSPFDTETAAKYGLKTSLEGVIITDISYASPAHRAGLMVGDLITAINRQPVKNIAGFNELVNNLKKGDTLYFRVIRQNRSFYVAFTL